MIYPSDALVDATFNLIKESKMIPEEYNFKELKGLIIKEFKSLSFFNFLSEFDVVKKNEFFDKNETTTKEILKTYPITNEVFNLNFFPNKIENEFFFNNDIELEEKQSLINIFSIRPKLSFCDILSLCAFADEELPYDINDCLKLSPVEDFFDFYKIYKDNEEIVNKMKTIWPDVVDYLERYDYTSDEIDGRFDFANKLFIDLNYVAATFVTNDEFADNYTFKSWIDGPKFLNSMAACKFYYEFNLSSAEYYYYADFLALSEGAAKEKDVYNYLVNKMDLSVNKRKNILNKEETNIVELMAEEFPIDEIVATAKNLANDINVDKESLQQFKDFYKGYDCITTTHNSPACERFYDDYLNKIVNLKEFEKYSTTKEKQFVKGFMESLLDKQINKEGER